MRKDNTIDKGPPLVSAHPKEDEEDIDNLVSKFKEEDDDDYEIPSSPDEGSKQLSDMLLEHPEQYFNHEFSSWGHNEGTGCLPLGSTVIDLHQI